VGADGPKGQQFVSGPPSPTGRPSSLSKAELFELIVESAHDFAIFTTDLSGLTTSWNIGAERLFGFPETEIVGSSADVVFTPEDQREGVPNQERLKAATNGRALDERWHQRKDGSRFWASGLMMPLNTADGFVKITRDRNEQHLAEQRLRENEERFRVLATSIPQLVFRTRPTGERTWPSPQWIDFTGLGFEASLGFGWLDAVHPDDREPTLAAWGTALESGGYYSEQRVWRAEQGEYRWHQTRARPVAEVEDDWVGTMTDIHDLRGLQDRQGVLLAELQHRTRNLLAVVQAIAGQTARRSASIEAFADEFEGRLRALGRVQSLLAQTDHRDVDLHTLVRAELAAHANGALDTDRVTVDGPPAALPATSAQALGLALHELATNALKYGALAQTGGRLSVIWRTVMQGPQRQVTLEWRESGVAMPAPDGPRRKGYGSELIQRALPYQLKASTSLEFGPDGVVCLIRVPVRGGKEGGGVD
jgi:PAS domain S-box-containing protein